MSIGESSLEAANKAPVSVCPGCGRELPEKFCPGCGEKKFDPHHLTLRHFFEQVVEVFTHADNRFFRSFRLLVTRPGFLTNEYMHGRRKAYLQPVQLFLVANLLFFLVQTFSVLEPLTTVLWAHTHAMPYQERAQRVVQQEISRRHVTLEEYSARFNAKEKTEAKTLVVFMVPCLALVLSLIYVFKDRPLVTHLVFSFHFYAFALLSLTVLGVLLTAFTFAWGDRLKQSTPGTPTYIPWLDLSIAIILGAFFMYYLFRSLRAVYASGRVVSFFLAGGIVVVVYKILTLYRIFLFFVTVHELA